MKKSLSSMMAALLLVCSCEDPGLLEQFGISAGDLDSSNISERLDDLEDRVSKLEAWCDAANSNITALQVAVQALESEDRIAEIIPIEENGTEVGYRFEFKSGKTISVYIYGNPEEGSSGGAMPIIAVKQDTDGSWYWTIDGEWLLDEDGKKVPAIGTTPKIKIEDNVWYVSYDEGKTWTAAGDAGDGAVSGGAVFSSVEYDKDYVYFTLTDGSLLTVPRTVDFDIVFECGNELVYSPNDILEVAYTIVGGDEMSIVKAFASEGWSAKVEKTDAVSGIIRVMSPSESKDGEIIVFVSDGRDKTLMRTLSFESGVMSVIDDTYTVGHEAATIEVKLTTNLDYVVQTDAEWLSVASGTKAVIREDVLVVTVEKNTRGPRTAKISLSSTSGHELQTISIYQEKDPDSTYWGIIGGLNNWSDDLFMDEIADGLWVAYNVAFEQEINEFKVRANEDWKVMYGMKEEQMLDADHHYQLMLDSEGGWYNIRVPQGVYDIYLDVNNERLYVMTPGKSIDEALNGTSVVLWEGAHNTDGWNFMTALSWCDYDWSVLKAGMKLTVYFYINGTDFSSFRIASGISWTGLPCLTLLEGYDEASDFFPLESSMTELSLTLTQEDVDAIQESNAGIVIGGSGYTLTKVVLKGVSEMNGDSDNDAGNDNDTSGGGYVYDEPIVYTPGEYVDLGLSVRWADRNVGAESVSRYGGYYAWGETEVTISGMWKDYLYRDTSLGDDFYHGDYLSIGDNISGTEYDIAHMKWGGKWRMPTVEELSELVEKCTWVWEQDHEGIPGCVITGPNGNSIFLPASGDRFETSVIGLGHSGCYWSGTLSSSGNCGSAVSFYRWQSDSTDNLRYNVDLDHWLRHDGHSVRPVLD